MDDHFSKMLAPTGAETQGNAPAFVSTSGYQGSRPGYIFQMNTQGLGYYLDPMQQNTGARETEVSTSDGKKRKLDSMSMDTKKPDQSTIEKLLEESDGVEVDMLNSESLKVLLLGFEKKINKNQKLRMKYPQDPEKFMDSEVELHEELNNLYAISASPELYPSFVQSGSVQSLLGMVAHDNTDVSLAAVGLLQELTDPETILESEETTLVLVDALLEGQCLELVVQNLGRLDEATSDEDSQGVHDSLSILENFLEVRPSLALMIGEKTHVLKFLLLRLLAKSFDPNKLYCSELLSMLLQNEASNAKRLANVAGVNDGLDMLLQIVAQHRKRDPEGSAEQECVQNLFLCLCTALMDTDNQNNFRTCEGIELMIRFLKENKYAATCAGRAITYAVSNNRENCERFISAGGFRYIFPLFMGRAFPPACKKAAKREIESASVSTVSQLCLQLHNVSEKDISQRLLAKFAENEHEKTDRAVELFVKYHSLLAQADRQTEQEIAHLSRIAERNRGPEGEAAELELELLEDADMQYVKRMDAGLHLLQQCAVMIAFVCVHVYNHSSRTSSSLIPQIQNKLAVDGCSLSDVQTVLREYAANIEVAGSSSSTTTSSSSSSSSSSGQRGGDRDRDRGGAAEAEAAQGQRQRLRRTLIEWGACLQHILHAK